ncbi:MAG: PTS sugar transporter subunit IIA [Streptococcaceae bacterium]|jgi:PTS system N-acetylgalactosamine-specific IIA component|nr:PTS sugar transporter subunit IIA [Streptococcaceae bacterium]
MIGALVVGHGNFAQGVYDALELIAGSQENFLIQCFQENAVLSEFEAEFTENVHKLAESGDDVFVFTDLKGGTPFNVAMISTATMPNVFVYSGTNLPMLLEFCGSRLSNLTTEAIQTALLLAGRDGISTQKLEEAAEKEDSDLEEGI